MTCGLPEFAGASKSRTHFNDETFPCDNFLLPANR